MKLLTKKEKLEIHKLLLELYPHRRCALEYSTPFELLVASRLSAQCTDVRVNIVTEELFKKYSKPEDFAELSVKGDYLYSSEDADNAEYVVKIEWIKTVSEANAEKELGFFGNQNTVCRPKAQRWEYTVERLKKIWNIDT